MTERPTAGRGQLDSHLRQRTTKVAKLPQRAEQSNTFFAASSMASFEGRESQQQQDGVQVRMQLCPWWQADEHDADVVNIILVVVVFVVFVFLVFFVAAALRYVRHISMRQSNERLKTRTCRSRNFSQQL